jgi:hypothetical protein
VDYGIGDETYRTDLKVYRVVTWDGRLIADLGDSGVCCVDGEDGGILWDGQGKINAQLIAAVPEMLKHLKTLTQGEDEPRCCACVFCGDTETHAPYCAWIEAKKFVESFTA